MQYIYTVWVRAIAWVRVRVWPCVCNRSIIVHDMQVDDEWIETLPQIAYLCTAIADCEIKYERWKKKYPLASTFALTAESHRTPPVVAVVRGRKWRGLSRNSDFRFYRHDCRTIENVIPFKPNDWEHLKLTKNLPLTQKKTQKTIRLRTKLCATLHSIPYHLFGFWKTQYTYNKYSWKKSWINNYNRVQISA
jgi:hypothetical protein